LRQATWKLAWFPWEPLGREIQKKCQRKNEPNFRATDNFPAAGLVLLAVLKNKPIIVNA
jgi:hypothetical protein